MMINVNFNAYQSRWKTKQAQNSNETIDNSDWEFKGVKRSYLIIKVATKEQDKHDTTKANKAPCH